MSHKAVDFDIDIEKYGFTEFCKINFDGYDKLCLV